jgi:hypothetical protein
VSQPQEDSGLQPIWGILFFKLRFF